MMNLTLISKSPLKVSCGWGGVGFSTPYLVLYNMIYEHRLLLLKYHFTARRTYIKCKHKTLIKVTVLCNSTNYVDSTVKCARSRLSCDHTMSYFPGKSHLICHLSNSVILEKEHFVLECFKKSIFYVGGLKSDKRRKSRMNRWVHISASLKPKNMPTCFVAKIAEFIGEFLKFCFLDSFGS